MSISCSNVLKLHFTDYEIFILIQNSLEVEQNENFQGLELVTDFIEVVAKKVD
jgi:hypothetical protein